MSAERHKAAVQGFRRAEAVAKLVQNIRIIILVFWLLAVFGVGHRADLRGKRR